MSDIDAVDGESDKRPSHGFRKRIWRSIRRSSRHQGGAAREDRSPSQPRNDKESPQNNLDDTSERSHRGKPRRSKSFKDRTRSALHALVGRGARRRAHASESGPQSPLQSVHSMESRAEPVSIGDQTLPIASDRVSPSFLSVPSVGGTGEDMLRPSSRTPNSTPSVPSPRDSPLPEARPRALTAGAHAAYQNITKKIFHKGQKHNKDFCLWQPSNEVRYEWQSLSGRSLTLNEQDCMSLSEAERKTLQKVALKRLSGFNLNGVQVTALPKGDGRHRGGMRKAMSLRNKGKLLGSETDGGSFEACVFNLPLSVVVKNDRDIRKRAPPPRSRPVSVASSDSLGESDQYSVSDSSILDDSPRSEDPPPPSHRAPTIEVDGVLSSESSYGYYSPSTYDSKLSTSQSMSFVLNEDFLMPQSLWSGRVSPMQATPPDLADSQDDLLAPSEPIMHHRTQLVEALSLPPALYNLIYIYGFKSCL